MKCFVVQSLCLTLCNPMDCSTPNFPVLNYLLAYAQTRASQVVQRLKHLPSMQESWVRSLGWEDPLEKEIATHSSILAWKPHGQRSLVGYTPRGSKESDTTERLHFLAHTHVHWVGAAIQPSHPLPPPSPAVNLSQPSFSAFSFSQHQTCVAGLLCCRQILYHLMGKTIIRLTITNVGFLRGDNSKKICLPMQETQETRVGFLGREDPLEKGKATHSSILAWRIPWTEELGGQSMRLQRVRHDWVQSLL